MSRFKGGLVLSIEQDETVIVEEVENSDNAYVVAAEATAEISTDIAVIENEVQNINDGIEVVEDLTKVQDVLINSEGLDGNAAEMAYIAVESICRGVGISNTMMLSRESYGHHNKKIATRLSVEAISNIVNKVWKAIKAVIARLKQMVVTTINKIFSKTSDIEKMIDATLKTIKELPSGLVKDKETLDNSTLARKFSYDGEANLTTVYHHTDNIDPDAGIIERAIQREYKIMEKIMTSSEHINPNTDPEVIAKNLANIYTREGDRAVEFNKDDPTHAYVKNIFGGKKLMVEVKSGDDGVVEFKLDLVTADDDKLADKIGVATKDELVTLLNQALDKAKVFKASKASVERAMTVYRSLLSLTDAAMRDVEADLEPVEGTSETQQEKELRTKVTSINKMITSYSTSFTNILSKTPFMQFDMLKSVIDYANACRKNLKASD